MSRLKEKSFLVLLLVFLLYFTLNIIEANITYCAIDDVECHKRMKTSSIKDVLLKKSTPNNYCSKNDIKCQKSSKTKQYNEEVRRALKMDQQKDSEFTPKIRKKRQNARQNFQTYAQNLDRGDYDMRVEEGWTNILYPFGRWVQDEELMGQAGREKQANLGFDCPYFGYRFNYTFVYPMGFVSFATPSYALPPYTFPNPEWPKERDHSFIAPYYADAAFQRIGSIKISNVFYRSVHRPRLDDDEYYNPYDPTRSNTGNQQTNAQTNFNPQTNQQQQQFTNQNFNTQQQTFAGRKKRQMPGRTNQPGMVIDPQLLDNITNHVQDSYTGANGWRAEHAFIVTWFRMSYGGAPRALDVSQFDYVKDWQNTFQLVIATDEIRTFAIFNYARLNWTSSTDAGGLNGFGGNPAYSGFNGGNGTGYYPLPYSGEGRIWKLGVFSNGVTPGRWIHRVDEVIVPAGCTNASTGGVITAPPWSISLGGGAVNVSGPCLREKDAIKVSFESWVVDCKRISVARARCVVPMFHKTGLVDVRLSRDGGASYPFVGKFYIISPHRAPPPVKLIDDVEKAINRWNQPNADVLSMAWQNLNLTWSTSARIDVTLWGYWEDADKSHFEKVFVLAKSVANSGSYNFKPAQLTRNMLIPNSYDRFQFGFVQVALTDNAEHGAMWSKITPFPWLNLPFWKDEHGDNWAINLCIEWFEYDGKRRNFVTELTWASPCPCKLEQALLDLGRYMPIMDCDEAGDTSCPYNKGARHCIQSVHPTTTGSSQQCCYDPEGYLMFSDDVEPSNAADYGRFFQPGTPARSHAFGAYPYKLPPFIPSLSHYQNDLLPYQMCCHYAQHCEFYYWRRQTNGCIDYRPPVAGYMYGEPHIVTYDGLKYTFPGKGYYVLTMSENPEHKLMVQVRLEQPDDTLWRTHVNATVITGVAIQENSSSIVQIFARKPMRRWRYAMDVYVDGVRRFFDQPQWKFQQFNSVSLRSPLLNMDMSEIIVMLKSGTGVKVSESNGMLDVMVFLPPSFNTTCRTGQTANSAVDTGVGTNRCYTTLGLLGTYNKDPTDDLTTISGTSTRVTGDTHSASVTQQIYDQFGSKWVVDGSNDRIGTPLFTDTFKPIYNPSLFGSSSYMPVYWPTTIDMNASRVITLEQVRVACMGVAQCEYDYILTGKKEIALTTLKKHKAFLALQKKGSRVLVSCGPLIKNLGVIKTPPSANYLDGDTVEFSCKPRYYSHGDLVRQCVNGTWYSDGSPGGAWVWCRSRQLEIALKWMTSILTIFGFILIATIFYCILWGRRKKFEKEQVEAGKNIRSKRRRQVSMRAEDPTKKELLSRETTKDVSDLVFDRKWDDAPTQNNTRRTFGAPPNPFATAAPPSPNPFATAAPPNPFAQGSSAVKPSFPAANAFAASRPAPQAFGSTLSPPQRPIFGASSSNTFNNPSSSNIQSSRQDQFQPRPSQSASNYQSSEI